QSRSVAWGRTTAIPAAAEPEAAAEEPGREGPGSDMCGEAAAAAGHVVSVNAATAVSAARAGVRRARGRSPWLAACRMSDVRACGSVRCMVLPARRVATQ